ncbi:MAG: LiaF domain-containing protein [Bacteroidota bacterium]
MDKSSPKNTDKSSKKPVVFGLPKYREKIITAISEAFANNDLDIEEYERRLDLAHDAKSIEDLRNTVYDFPQVNSLLPIAQQQEQRPTFPSSTPNYAPSPAESFRKSFENLDHLNIIGDKRIYSTDITKPNIKVITVIGETFIDLREVALKFNHIKIENYCAIGSIKIRVPHNAQIKKNMIVLIGDTKKKKVGASFIKKLFGMDNQKPVRYDPNPPELFIEVSGFMLIGDLIIEYMPEPIDEK